MTQPPGGGRITGGHTSQAISHSTQPRTVGLLSPAQSVEISEERSQQRRGLPAYTLRALGGQGGQEGEDGGWGRRQEGVQHRDDDDGERGDPPGSPGSQEIKDVRGELTEDLPPLLLRAELQAGDDGGHEFVRLARGCWAGLVIPQLSQQKQRLHSSPEDGEVSAGSEQSAQRLRHHLGPPVELELGGRTVCGEVVGQLTAGDFAGGQPAVQPVQEVGQEQGHQGVQ